jgi:hypothetical protein
VSFLLDRFTEFDVFAVALPWLLIAGFIAYPILQVAALMRMTGWLRYAAWGVLILVLVAVGGASALFAQKFPIWMAPLVIVIPLAMLLLVAMTLAFDWHRRWVQVGTLGLVMVGLVMVVGQRGLGWQLGAAPAAIRGEFQTEDAWIATEIARDIAEMLPSGDGKSQTPSDIRLVRSQPGVFSAESRRLGQTIPLDLRTGMWNIEQFSTLASALVATSSLTASTAASASPGVHEALLDPYPRLLVETSRAASTALAADMANRDAHAAAALTIGAFALREAAGHFQDVRWALNRMTAHLSIARALTRRFSLEPSTDEALAEATLLTLANEETAARSLLSNIGGANPSTAIAAWQRALQIRLTQDWRLLTNVGQASVLEKSEYLRARREGASGTAAAPDLGRLGIDPTTSAHWLRIIQSGYRGVSEGHMFADAALPLELGEAAEVFGQLGLAGDVNAHLNDRAGRCMTPAGPQVLPWGAWAEFSQRHLAMLVGNVNRHYVLGLGMEAGAVVQDVELDARMKDMAMFPLATTYRLRGPRGSDADLRRINDAIRTAYETPERVPADVWGWLEKAANYESVRAGMPRSADWFGGPVTTYDAGARTSLLNDAQSIDRLDHLRRAAPSDYGIATTYLRVRFGLKIPFPELRQVLGHRLQHDLRAINYAKKYLPDNDARIDLLEEACTVSAVECGELGGALANAGREDEAASRYHEALGDPGVDPVWKSNNSGWLVDYYQRRGRNDQARQLAEEAASSGSFGGILTLAKLEERAGNIAAAEGLHQRSAERYEDPTFLAGFYQRRVRDFNEHSWETQWTELRTRLFPEGIQPAPTSMPAPPVRGVIVTTDNDRSRKAGLQAGDVIVGLEGHRVDNLQQYRALNASYLNDELHLTVWRGTLFNISATTPGRLFGIDIRTHPLQGWGEK